MIKAEGMLMIKELNYDITKDDLKNYAKDLMNINYYKKQRLLTSVLIPACIIIPVSFFIHEPLFGKLFFMIFFLLCFSLISFFNFPKTISRKIVMLSKNTDFSNNKIFIDSENSVIKTEHNLGNTEYNWSVIKDIYNLKYSILIFTQPYMAIIIPKRIFETEQEMNETWELIKECYDKSRGNVND